MGYRGVGNRLERRWSYPSIESLDSVLVFDVDDSTTPNPPTAPTALATDNVPIAVVPPLETMGLLADLGVEGLGEGGECLMAMLGAVNTVWTTGPVLASPAGRGGEGVMGGELRGCVERG